MAKMNEKSTLYTAVVLILTLWVFTQRHANCETSCQSPEPRFPNLDAVRKKGVVLTLSDPDSLFSDSGEYLRLFPSLRFTCSGHITKIMYITNISSGVLDSTAGTGHPAAEFQLWTTERNTTGGSMVYRKTFTTADIVETEPRFSEHFELHEWCSVNVTFAAGDILGLYQPSLGKTEFIYHRGGMSDSYYISDSDVLVVSESGETATVQEENEQSEIDSANSIPDANNYVHPLVAVETDQQQCVEGFLSKETLRDIIILDSEEVEVEPPQFSSRIEQFAFPELNFSCDGRITKIRLGGKRKTVGDVSLRISTWRLLSQEGSQYVYTRNGNFLLSADELNITDTINVYEYVFPGRGRRVEANTVFGLRHGMNSSVELYYEQDTELVNYRDAMHSDNNGTYRIFELDPTTSNTPLLSIEFTKSECINENFIDKQHLEEAAFYIGLNNISTTPNTQHVFPEMEFKTSGYLKQLVFVAEYNEEAINNETIPEFQIWRNINGKRLIKSGSTNSSTLSLRSTSYLNVYEYVIPDNSIEVREGDVLGVFQPAVTDQADDRSPTAFLSLVFVNNSGPRAYSKSSNVSLYNFTLSNNQTYLYMLPLVTVRIQDTNKTSYCESTSQARNTSSFDPNSVTTDTSDQSNFTKTFDSKTSNPSLSENDHGTPTPVTSEPVTTELISFPSPGHSPEAGILGIVTTVSILAVIVVLLVLILLMLVLLLLKNQVHRISSRITEQRSTHELRDANLNIDDTYEPIPGDLDKETYHNAAYASTTFSNPETKQPPRGETIEESTNSTALNPHSQKSMTTSNQLQPTASYYNITVYSEGAINATIPQGPENIMTVVDSDINTNTDFNKEDEYELMLPAPVQR